MNLPSDLSKTKSLKNFELKIKHLHFHKDDKYNDTTKHIEM